MSQLRKLKLRQRREHVGMPSHPGQSHGGRNPLPESFWLGLLKWSAVRRLLAQAQKKVA